MFTVNQGMDEDVREMFQKLKEVDDTLTWKVVIEKGIEAICKEQNRKKK